ncbi:MAG: hypothetical protein NTX79_06515 [Candidatus Micrarchaeota archaeon]|nr:hypothetical protein [Candidatus Micrarchaeota archaeon]
MEKSYIAIIAFLLLAGTSHADSTNSTNYGDLISALTTGLTNLPGKIVDSFFSYAVSGLISSSHQLVDSSFKFMFSTPNPMWFCTPYNGVMAIVESLYSLTLMGLALYFILRSNDAEGRASAKKWMENMLVMVVILTFSFQIFRTMLDFSTFLATSAASESMKSIFTSPLSFSTSIFSLVILIPAISGMFLTFLTLLLRYLLIPFLLFLFPFSIFLYFTPLTQRWGKAFLSIIVAIVFMTTFDALILLGLSSLFNSQDPNLADSLARAFAVLFGFAAIGLVNLLIFILSILSIILQNNTVRSVLGFAVAGKVLTR